MIDWKHLEALETAQTQAASLLLELQPQLSEGLSIPELQEKLASLARARDITLAQPARFMLGESPTGIRPAFLRPLRLHGPALLGADVHVRVGEVVGDFARPLRFGEEGRHWFYLQLARRIQQNWLDSLSQCRTEADAHALARACAEKEGGRLLNPTRTLGHHVPVPFPTQPLEAQLRQRKEWLEHRVKGCLPLRRFSPPLDKGLWSLEPVYWLDRHHFRFEDLFARTERGFERLGNPAQLDAVG